MIRITKILGSIIVAGLITMIIVGCENQNLPSVGEGYNQPVTIQRAPLHFRLENVQSFNDNDAYSNIRSVYILKDLETGKEYIGVSGIGISERGSHSSGKTQVSDER